VLFVQTGDLRDDRNELQQELVTVSQVADQLPQMEAVRFTPDVESLTLASTPSQPQAWATYYWSDSTGTAAIVCHNLPTLEENLTYQLWLLVGDRQVSAGTFNSWNDIALYTLDFQTLELEQGPKKVSVSIEPAGGSDSPTGVMILTGSLP
jgi:anti-sigma-K factor RskA